MCVCTCDDVEALLPLDESDVVGYECRVHVALHAGVSGLLQHQPARPLQELGPHVGHRGGHGRRGEAHHAVQQGYDITQTLQGVHVTWGRRGGSSPRDGCSKRFIWIRMIWSLKCHVLLSRIR